MGEGEKGRKGEGKKGSRERRVGRGEGDKERKEMKRRQGEKARRGGDGETRIRGEGR